MKSFLILFGIIFFNFQLFAQVGVGTISPDGSSILDITSTEKGLLIPRLTTTQRDAITSPANGLLIFNTDSDEIQFNSNNPTTPVWVAFSVTPTSTASPGDSIKYSNTDISTNLNVTPAIDLPIFGTTEWNDNGTLYSVSGDELTVNETGRYDITVNVALLNGAATARNAPEIRLTVNGIEVGSYASTGYIRSNNGHDESSLNLREVIELTAGDVVAVNIERSGNNNLVTMRSAGSSNFYIEKLN